VAKLAHPVAAPVEATERLADDHVANAEVERDREVALPIGKHVNASITSDVSPYSHADFSYSE
jgi:hypothetical protein